jgi:hypothetical protein
MAKEMEPVEPEETPPALVTLGTPPFSSPDPTTIGLNPLAHITNGESEDAVEEEGGDGEMKASEWKDEIEGASSQEELDAVVQRYSESGADYKSVESAIEKKQDEINEAAESGN